MTYFFDVQLVRPAAQLPIRKLKGAGWDLFPCDCNVGGKLQLCEDRSSQDHGMFEILGGRWVEEIGPGEVGIVRLGFKAAISAPYHAIYDDRSSVGLSGGLHLAGVIDGNYRAEWLVLIYNAGKNPILVNPKKAIVQALIIELEDGILRQVDNLESSERGIGAFGSTDSKIS